MGEKTLFETGPRLKLPAQPATPYRPGSGPAGERCGTCRHLARIPYHDKHYLKCEQAKNAWTHGGASDIKAKWPACRGWRPKGYDELALRLTLWSAVQWLKLEIDTPLGIISDAMIEAGHADGELFAKLAQTDFEAQSLPVKEAHGSPGTSVAKADAVEIPF